VSSLGVSLTHREHAHGVLFVTGHAKPGDGVNWATLSRTAAQAKLTLVIYMGIRGAEQLQTDLLQGLPADTPVAVIHNVSLPDQRHAFCTLETLHATVVREALASPSVIVVGDVLEGLASAQSHAFTQVLRDAQG
jgi:uroporphyrin-III C-methyltransferase